ncbi:MAG: hypothetical protein HY727_07215 [Candidatus Rokubacteria bacterium]|nr:hypothetical protein [Candidatus Rokubacteria bacterium]
MLEAPGEGRREMGDLSADLDALILTYHEEIAILRRRITDLEYERDALIRERKERANRKERTDGQGQGPEGAR